MLDRPTRQYLENKIEADILKYLEDHYNINTFDHSIYSDIFYFCINTLETIYHKESKIENQTDLKVLEFSDLKEFEQKSKELFELGYKLSSSSCGFVQSEAYDFCSSYQAIFIKE